MDETPRPAPPSKQDLLRHLVDAVLPNAAFVVGHEVAGVREGVIATLAVGLVLLALRLAARRRPTFVLGAFGIVAVHAGTVVLTGEGRNFFLPWMLLNAVLLVVFLISLVRRRPLTAKPAAGLGLSTHPGTHLRVTALWTALWALHLVIAIPLYAAHQVAALGVADFVLGPPALLLWGFLSWRMLRRASAPETVTLPEPARGRDTADHEAAP